MSIHCKNTSLSPRLADINNFLCSQSILLLNSVVSNFKTFVFCFTNGLGRLLISRFFLGEFEPSPIELV